MLRSTGSHCACYRFLTSSIQNRKRWAVLQIFIVNLNENANFRCPWLVEYCNKVPACGMVSVPRVVSTFSPGRRLLQLYQFKARNLWPPQLESVRRRVCWRLAPLWSSRWRDSRSRDAWSDAARTATSWCARSAVMSSAPRIHATSRCRWRSATTSRGSWRTPPNPRSAAIRPN